MKISQSKIQKHDPHEMEDRFSILQQEKETLQDIMDKVQDGFCDVDLNGTTERFNNAFCEIIGFPPEKTKGLNFREYTDKRTASVVYKRFNEVYKSRLPKKMIEYRIKREDGTNRYVEVSAVLRYDSKQKPIGFRCIARDITARRQAEEEADLHRNRLEAIFRSVQDAIITVEPDQKVIAANEAIHSICGILPRDIIGNIFTDESNLCKRTCREVMKETLQNKNAIREYQINCHHRLKRHQRVSLSTSPLRDPEGQFTGAILVIRDITRLSDLERELKEWHRFHNIVGKSSKMQEVFKLIEDLADFETTVLIIGESGTGKELVARALHYTGNRAFKPFISVNCAALSENLLESELFGHVKGAFTGAIRDSQGRFQAADSGTLLLDEIGDISPLLQLKLLRVLQEKQFERVGDTRPIKVDVRVIACTNQDLRAKVDRGDFRKDLYYRLKVVEINLPPLREKLEDLPLLVEYFISRFETKFKRKIPEFSDQICTYLMNYPWPGNVRELEHCIERIAILCRGETVSPDHLPPEITEKNNFESVKVASTPSFLASEEVLHALEKAGWNKAKAARFLRISRKTLYKKIKKFNLLATQSTE